MAVKQSISGARCPTRMAGRSRTDRARFPGSVHELLQHAATHCETCMLWRNRMPYSTASIAESRGVCKPRVACGSKPDAPSLWLEGLTKIYASSTLRTISQCRVASSPVTDRAVCLLTKWFQAPNAGLPMFLVVLSLYILMGVKRRLSAFLPSEQHCSHGRIRAL